LVAILFLLFAERIQAQEEVTRTLDTIEKKYSDLKDYSVDVNVHFDMESLKAPDMQAKLYYKAPDKMKVDSKKIFFFPKEGGYFNPSLFKKKDFEVTLLERLTYKGEKSVKLKLIPKEASRYRQIIIVTIDIEQNLIKEIEISPSDLRKIKTIIEYGTFYHFDLPIQIEVHLEMASSEPNGTKEFPISGQKAKRIAGKVEITYSNYKVNSDLSDEIFKETESHPPK
jgi:outer membrane lipoprotein-sorting protein